MADTPIGLRWLCNALHYLESCYGARSAAPADGYERLVSHLKAAEQEYMRLFGEKGKATAAADTLLTWLKEEEVANQDFEKAAQWRVVIDLIRKTDNGG